MGWSRTRRLQALLVIDCIFFFVEIVSGYAVGSLALVADSFHMLNDVVSLLVALYAIKLADRTDHNASKFSYGWQRAEILGSLINGVFLVALCFSIFLEAIERFFSNPDITNPRLVVIVGSLGLLSNIVGLVLFHDHGHAHGGGHSHGHGHAVSSERASEEGHAHPVQPSQTGKPYTDEDEDFDDEEADELDELLYAHPAAARANLIRAARDNTLLHSRRKRSSSSASKSSLPDFPRSRSQPKVATLVDVDEHDSPKQSAQNGHVPHDHSHSHDEETGHSHGGGGHSHGGSMNMRGVFLHVLGDFLGNIGVVASGLIIWLTTFPARFYSDPIISLIITIIIFSSAMPLVRSASYILLQGTPSDVPLDEVRSAILRIPGVEDVHELHVWSLSESKVIGSVHVLVKSSDEYIHVSGLVREVMHRFGIHSSTIQPETLEEFKTALKNATAAKVPSQQLNAISEAQFSKAASSSTCLVQCVNACDLPGCCNTSKAPSLAGSDHAA